MKKAAIVLVLFMASGLSHSYGQASKNNKVNYLIEIIDSLDRVIVNRNATISKADSALRAERATGNDLRDQLITLDEMRKKLEANINTYQGENLKLNQSNRILVIFNSFVAVLLIVTLVFYLRKINKKAVTEPSANAASQTKKPQVSVHASFEDKLQQLERLGKLREKGLLSDEEFLFEKNQVLGK
ncbi:MAG TPA: SHOCT domain-containing protein [Bacteroidia bacterium]|nr:SHOCT domain-containing protein [Bacteroidia bacterium]